MLVPAFKPGGRNEAVVELRPIHAVELRRLVKKVDETERHDIDTGRTPVKVIVKPEVDVGLFELYRASQLVICIVGDAAVLELNLGIEDDIIGDLIVGSSTMRWASKPSFQLSGVCCPPISVRHKPPMLKKQRDLR